MVGKPATARQEEIDIIKQWLKDERVEKIETKDLEAGDHFTYTRGSLKVKEAIVTEIGNNRLRLILGSLGAIVNIKTTEI